MRHTASSPCEYPLRRLPWRLPQSLRYSSHAKIQCSRALDRRRVLGSGSLWDHFGASNKMILGLSVGVGDMKSLLRIRRNLLFLPLL